MGANYDFSFSGNNLLENSMAKVGVRLINRILR